MGELCKIEQMPKQFTAHIRLRTSATGLPEIIGSSYSQLASFIQEKGMQITGAPYTAYFNMDRDDLDVEIGFPVNTSFEDEGGITSGIIAAGQFATYMHKGQYSEMEPSYGILAEWIESQDAKPTGVAYEFYFNSPDEVLQSELETKILFPLQGE